MADSALNKQHGGSHYKDRPVQPVELWAQLNLNGFQASIVKYLTRYKEKGGFDDLRKAEHFFELMIELKQYSRKDFLDRLATLPRKSAMPIRIRKAVNDYCYHNKLDNDTRFAILAALSHNSAKSIPEANSRFQHYVYTLRVKFRQETDAYDY